MRGSFGLETQAVKIVGGLMRFNGVGKAFAFSCRARIASFVSWRATLPHELPPGGVFELLRGRGTRLTNTIPLPARAGAVHGGNMLG